MADVPWVPRTPSDRREAPRFNISLPVTFSIISTGRICSGLVDNLSLGGVLLVTDERLDREENIIIHLPIAHDTTVNVEASIVRTSNLGEVGVAFASLSDEAMQRLSDFVDGRPSREV